MKSQVVVALDLDNLNEALKIVSIAKQYDRVWGFKLGVPFLLRNGTLDGFVKVRSKGVRIFADLKLHDIPQTVYRSVKSLIPYNASIVTVHALGGKEMMQAAVEAAEGTDLQIFATLGLTSNPLDKINKETLFKDIVDSGVHGIVGCSELFSKIYNNKLPIKTALAGVRPDGDSVDDHVSVTDLSTAVFINTDLIVMGRPFLKNGNYEENFETIMSQLK